MENAFDSKFDEGKEDVIEDLDLSTARRVNQGQKREGGEAAATSYSPAPGAQRYPAEAASSGLEEYKRSTRPRLPIGGRGVPKRSPLTQETVETVSAGHPDASIGQDDDDR